MKYRKDYPEYKNYLCMQKNCNSPYDNCYTNNNIQIHPSWVGDNGFWTFLKDLGTKPSEKHKLFRIEVLDDYSKKNCLWSINNPNILPKQKYKRKKEKIIYQNKSYKNFTAFCRAFNLLYKRSYYRKQAGWSLEDIIKEPNQFKNPTRRHLNPFFNYYNY